MYADSILINGNVITMDPRKPRAEAVAVKHGRIIEVGTSLEIKELAGKDTMVIDVQRKTVAPGFIDAHNHMLSTGRTRYLLVDCSPEAVASIADLKQAIRERAQATPKGHWVRGRTYDDTKLAEMRHPNRWDLDEAAPDHPVHIGQVSGHISVVNSRALELAHITVDTPDPIGGCYDRDPATGELTGVCRESAGRAFAPLMPPPTVEEDREAIKLVCKLYTEAGITSCTDPGIGPRDLRAYQDALAHGELPIRMYLFISNAFFPQFEASGIRTGFGNERLRIGAIKLMVDGAIAGRTAYVSEPYVGSPDDYGILVVESQEVLDEQVLRAHRAGFQIGTHANGDRAIDMILNAYEKALTKLPRENHRHRIEHCTIVNPQILERMKRLGILAIPFGSYIWQHGEKMVYYGPERVARMFPHRSFLDYGIPVAGSSDHPPGPYPPLLGIHSCVTRKSHTGEVLGADQKIMPEEALRLYTMGGAYASFDEHVKGSLETGKLADFVVLSEDPTSVSPDSIKDIAVAMTIVGGEVVFERG